MRLQRISSITDLLITDIDENVYKMFRKFQQKKIQLRNHRKNIYSIPTHGVTGTDWGRLPATCPWRHQL